MARTVPCAVPLLWACVLLRAAEPVVTHLFPAGQQVGTRAAVQCGGAFDDWPVNAWTDDPELVFKASETRGVFTVETSDHVRPGPHLVRVYDRSGASAPAQFVVGADPEMVRAASPTNEAGSFLDRFPVTLNGQLTTTHRVDTWRLVLPDNGALQVAVCAVALDSPLSASLELLDGATNRLALVEARSGVDPTLSYSVLGGGLCLLRVSGLLDAGAVGEKPETLEAGVYRATVSVQRVPPAATSTAEAVRPVQTAVEMFRPMVAVRTLMIPSVTRGVISPAGRHIHYGFESRGQERFNFRVRAASVGSPLSPVLRILDAEMQPLAEAVPGGDAELVWVSPAEGHYIATVSDAQANGSPVHAFQLEVGVPQPFYRAAAPSHTYRLERGATTTVTVELSRPSASRSVLQVAAVGLPKGVRALPQTAEPGATAVQLELQADADAAPANQSFLVSVVNVGAVPPEIDFARAPLRGRYAPPGRLLINETEHLWLTVRGAP